MMHSIKNFLICSCCLRHFICHPRPQLSLFCCPLSTKLSKAFRGTHKSQFVDSYRAPHIQKQFRACERYPRQLYL